jgi:hypothetical protein
MIPARISKDGKDQRRSSPDFLSLKAFVLLLIAGGIGQLSVRSPRSGAAAVTAVKVLALLNKMVG